MWQSNIYVWWTAVISEDRFLLIFGSFSEEKKILVFKKYIFLSVLNLFGAGLHIRSPRVRPSSIQQPNLITTNLMFLQIYIFYKDFAQIPIAYVWYNLGFGKNVSLHYFSFPRNCQFFHRYWEISIWLKHYRVGREPQTNKKSCN